VICWQAVICFLRKNLQANVTSQRGLLGRLRSVLFLRTPSCSRRTARREEQNREFVLINPTQSSNVLNVHRPHSIQKSQLFAGRTNSIDGPQFAHPCRRPLCSKIADLHGIEVHDVRTRKFVYFRKIFRFLLNNIRDVTKGRRGHNPPSA